MKLIGLLLSYCLQRGVSNPPSRLDDAGYEHRNQYANRLWHRVRSVYFGWHCFGWHCFGWHCFGWHCFGWHCFGWHCGAVSRKLDLVEAEPIPTH